MIIVVFSWESQYDGKMELVKFGFGTRLPTSNSNTKARERSIIKLSTFAFII